jgi:hypothetical protein
MRGRSTTVTRESYNTGGAKEEGRRNGVRKEISEPENENKRKERPKLAQLRVLMLRRGSTKRPSGKEE